MNEVEELTNQIQDLEKESERQLGALNTQRAVIDYLLDCLEQLALDNDLEVQVDAIIARISNGEIKAEPKIIL